MSDPSDSYHKRLVLEITSLPMSESVFARLKQRKLVQWSVAYLAGSWVVLEVVRRSCGRRALRGEGLGFRPVVDLQGRHPSELPRGRRGQAEPVREACRGQP